jgi:hypothetical protein
MLGRSGAASFINDLRKRAIWLGYESHLLPFSDKRLIIRTKQGNGRIFYTSFIFHHHQLPAIVL